MTQKLGLYLHIPFCRSKCLYCDFCSFPHPRPETVEAYLAALERELIGYADQCKGWKVDTVYFGGGTPTLLPPGRLERLLDLIVNRFCVESDAEITAECNPATGGHTLFSGMRRAGFNRLSIGAQSIHTAELQALGRIHSASDLERTYGEARESGFDSISLDVMFGIPRQTADSYLQTLEFLLALSPEHLSAYGLIVEEGTPFARRGSGLILPDEEETRKMYFSGAELLGKRGYEQYEISNFAKPGFCSKHNLKYWNCDPYLGIGVAAYSDFGGARFGNSRDMDAYLAGADIRCDREEPTHAQRMDEYVMLRLRLAEGVRESDFLTRFGKSFDEIYGKRLKRFIPDGLVCRTSDGYALTRQGFYVSNAILSDVLTFAE